MIIVAIPCQACHTVVVVWRNALLYLLDSNQVNSPNVGLN